MTVFIVRYTVHTHWASWRVVHLYLEHLARM